MTESGTEPARAPCWGPFLPWRVALKDQAVGYGPVTFSEGQPTVSLPVAMARP